MDNIPASQSYLESLTTRELIILADTHGIDIPPGLDRVFIIEELQELTAFQLDFQMDIDLDVELKEESSEEPHGKFPESVVLPKQYNITFIETLVRDPLWVYIYWEVKGADRELFEKAPDFNGYFLRIVSINTSAANTSANPEEVFTVPIEPEDNARYLGFPPAEDHNDTDKETEEILARVGQRSFKIELYAKKGKENNFLSASEVFTLPSLPPRSEKKALDKYPLIKMSGIEDFNIIRNADRDARIKRGANTA